MNKQSLIAFLDTFSEVDKHMLLDFLKSQEDSNELSDTAIRKLEKLISFNNLWNY